MKRRNDGLTTMSSSMMIVCSLLQSTSDTPSVILRARPKFVLRCVAKDVEVRVGRVRIAPQRVEGKPEVLGPAVGEQRDRRRHAAQAFPKNARTLSITASRALGDMPG